MPRYYLFKKCEQRNNGSAAHSNNYGAIADIKDQASGNYVYNAIGELNYDRISSIDSVKWNVYGKMQHIYKHAATYGTAATGLHYYYDPSGNRVGRAVLYNPSTSYNSYTWYVRDAQGNVLATYRTIGSDITTSTLKLIEHHMYGSSRLGIINRDMDVDQGKPNVVETSQANLGTGYLITFTKGNKLFELTNHLGNVLVTVTDVKTPTPKSGTPSQVGGYIANMVVATDYTPFGMIMQGRNYNNAAGDKYRYGFNGKEYDNSVKGTGNEIDYGERPYDPMGGRFWSVDKLTGKFPGQSPYVYAANNPILFLDNGSEAPGLPPLFNPAAFVSYVGFANPVTLWGFQNAKNSSLAHLQKAAWYSSSMLPFGSSEFHNVKTNWNTLYGISGEIEMVERFYKEIAPNQVMGNPKTSLLSPDAVANSIQLVSRTVKIDFEPDKYTDYMITFTPEKDAPPFIYSFDDIRSNFISKGFLLKQSIKTEYSSNAVFVHEVKIVSPNNDKLLEIIETGVKQLLTNQRVRDGGIPVLVIDTKSAEAALRIDANRFSDAIKKLRELGGGLASETDLNKAASDRLNSILKTIRNGTVAPPKNYYNGTDAQNDTDDKENK